MLDFRRSKPFLLTTLLARMPRFRSDNGRRWNAALARLVAVLGVIAVWGSVSRPLLADEAVQATGEPSRTRPREWSVSLRWENDTFGGTDRFYTDGVLLSLTHTGPSWMDPVADWLPWGEGRRTVG